MIFRIIILLSAFILAGCTLPWTQTESQNTEGLVPYTGTWFQLSIPVWWKQTKQDLLPIPKKWIIVLATTSPESRYGFSNTILVLEDEIKTPITSKKYSEINSLQSKPNYLEYTEIEKSPVLFVDDDESIIHVFEARYNNTTSTLKFLQTAKVCGSKVYLIHIAVSPEKKTENYKNLIKTFKCYQ